MRSQSLNGKWLYRVGKGAESEKEIPFSALPVGHSECRKLFDAQEAAKQTFLKFDGITYHAKVTLNGEPVGEMLPYSEYVFDVTGAIKEKNNELKVELEDIAPTFGPSAGWGNYGGIIRDVNLLFADESYIKDVFFYTELENGYTDAKYTVETELGAPIDGEIRITLSYGGDIVDQTVAPATEKKTVRAIKNVKLWSTDEPNLYQLKVELLADGKTLDSYECNVGFREIKCDRHRFIINGKPTFLLGVCKHEMVQGYGHTVPEALIEKELRAIKDTGCNFVRLVHYPHSKKTLEIADRIGIMVSEEPGLWWSRTEIPEVSGGSLEVLKRTVLRDRNHPSVAFWLSFNECRFTEQFLIDSAKICRELDPTRLVSGANCMSNEDTVKYYNICGFDFYTMHPYSDTVERAVTSATVLNDKPLLFTEWGGYHVYDNPHLLTNFIDTFYGLYERNSDEGAVAGAFFWYWREVNDYGRAGKACVDGVLKEALVDYDGAPTLIYDAYKKAWAEHKTVKRYEDKYYFTANAEMKKTPLSFVSGGGDYSKALEKATESEWEKAKFNGMRYRRLTLGPVLQCEEVNGIALTPYVLADGTSLTFAGDGKNGEITVLGAIGMNKGYPISGEYGETAATVTVEYENGTTEISALRNGVEITTVYTSLGSSMIEPVAEKTVPFAHFGYDKNFENYLINALTLPVSGKVKRITLTSADKGYDVLVYGLYM